MRYVAYILVAVAVTGCAAHNPRVVAPAASDHATSGSAAAPAPADSLETFMAKFRKLSAEARPEPRQPLATVERTDERLRNALAAATFAPSPETLRDVAFEYRRVGIFDKAYQYLQSALTLQPRDAATYDAFARLWRDSGFPELGLGDAYRAVFYAPNSAPVHNTLGTVLQALGRKPLARAEYERALQLDVTAVYALNNLCYGWVLDGESSKAVSACERALAIEPGWAVANNNLALAHAVAGDMAATRQAFSTSGDRASQLYNAGIVYLATRQYRSAVDAFEGAHTARPSMTLALTRARQAAAEAKAHPEHGRGEE